VLGQAGDDGPDVRGIADNGDDGPRVSTPGTAQRSDIVNHGKKTRPCLPAVARAYSMNLSGFPRGRRPILLPTVPALGGSRGEGGVVFPGSTAAGGIQTVAAQQMPAAGGDVERQLGDEVQAGEMALLAFEESLLWRLPGDGVLLLISFEQGLRAHLAPGWHRRGCPGGRRGRAGGDYLSRGVPRTAEAARGAEEALSAEPWALDMRMRVLAVSRPAVSKEPAAFPPLTSAERRDRQARRVFTRLAAGRGKRCIWWQLRSRP
jgi:hypothetical protein